MTVDEYDHIKHWMDPYTMVSAFKALYSLSLPSLSPSLYTENKIKIALEDL